MKLGFSFIVAATDAIWKACCDADLTFVPIGYLTKRQVENMQIATCLKIFTVVLQTENAPPMDARDSGSTLGQEEPLE